MYGTSVTALLISFMAICFLSTMVDAFTRCLEKLLSDAPWPPMQKFEPEIVYLVVFFASLAVCWLGNFNFFACLGFSFGRVYEGWIMTAFMVSGGSALVKSAFGVVNMIPAIVSMVIGYFSSGTTTLTTEPLYDPASPP